jgi:hypothetical protein
MQGGRSFYLKPANRRSVVSRQQPHRVMVNRGHTTQKGTSSSGGISGVEAAGWVGGIPFASEPPEV